MEVEPKKFNQIFIGIVTHLTSLSPSMCLGFSSIIVPILTSNANLNRINVEQASWIASVVTLTYPIGCLSSGSLSDKFGRKRIILLSNFVAFTGWFIIYLAFLLPNYQYALLIIGNLITGLSAGMVLTIPIVYMAEISTTSTRSMFTTWNSVSFSLGILLVFALGSLFKEDWGNVAIIATILPVISAIFTFLYLPESPLWLMSQNKLEEAERCNKLLGHQQRSDKETNEKFHLAEPRKQPSNLSFYKRLLEPTCWKPMLIVLSYFFFLQFCGTFVILAYALDFSERLHINVNPYWIICIIAITRVIGSLVIGVISNNFGRRPLSLVSAVGMSFCMLGLAFYVLFVSKYHVEAQSIFASLSALFLLSLYFFMATGFITIPYSISSELFSSDVRGFLCGFASFVSCILNFINVKIYFNLITWLGSYFLLLFLYGLVSVAGSIFIYLYLPETRAKTLEDIEKYFDKKIESKRSSV